MSAEDNKALVRRFYAEIDKGNLEAMDELVAEDYLDHNPPPFPGLRPGREGLKQSFKIFLKATPGYHRIEDQIAEGDRVVTRLLRFAMDLHVVVSGWAVPRWISWIALPIAGFLAYEGCILSRRS
jgi:ketosteroid isomerase-like protein